jgi:RNA polymerase sigma-70 factor (ECF subfamily)
LRNSAAFGYGFALQMTGRPVSALPRVVQGVMADLLRRVAEQADLAAFRELYQTYGPRVKAYMMRQGADAATAEDLAQETLFTVWRRASLYAEDKGSVATWIFAIARNLRIDRLRREVPWQELPEGRLEQPSDETPPDEARVGEASGRAGAGRACRVAARAARGGGLSYIDGLSHGEIAARLGLPLGTVKSRMRIAYQRIPRRTRGPEMTITHHLDDATLMSFAAGALPAALSAVAAAHADMCPAAGGRSRPWSGWAGP